VKVTFVHAPDAACAAMQTFGVPIMPTWAYTLAAHIAELPEVESTLVDTRFDSLAATAPADVFLFSGLNQDYATLVEAHRVLRARFPRARTVVGGPICWSFHTAGLSERLAMFDHVVIGDGEAALPTLLEQFRAGTPVPWLIEITERFPLAAARPMHRPLLAQTLDRYYGAVLEVARGCPFLCEFCDIRVLPDNNRTHVKTPAAIVAELETLVELGARQVIFACDNLIGDVRWAETLCDAIIDWRARSGRAVSIQTWLTVNVARHPTLLRKLRAAGVDLLFIGVESFNRSSLLETAKVQNTSVELAASLRAIQSYGFVVIAGLIFGFDTDPDDIAAMTLQGVLDSGLISGDPSLLVALPGTPLYTRLQLAGRLRDGKLGLGGFKYQTNVRYLRPAARIREDFRRFVTASSQGAFQYRRLSALFDCFAGANFVPSATAGYADAGRLLTVLRRDPRAARLAIARLWAIGGSPRRLIWALAGAVMTFRRSTTARPLWSYLSTWLLMWSTTVLKYGGLRDSDFDVESVEPGFVRATVLPDGYGEQTEKDVRPEKVAAQRRLTTRALREFLAPPIEP
jgi:radical SAM superfamily enzyme YgiQ (UPF0313 family)